MAGAARSAGNMAMLHKQHSLPVTSDLFDAHEQAEALKKANNILHRSSITSLPSENYRPTSAGNIWADQFSYLDHKLTAGVNEVDWLKEFEQDKKAQEQKNEEFNTQFWDRLHNEWKKISEEQDSQHPWLSDFTEYYDPYKVIYPYYY